MKRFQRKLVKFGFGFVLFSFSCGFVLWIVNDSQNALQHEKRDHLDIDDLWHFDDVPLDIDNEKWLQKELEKKIEGQLVCAKRKVPKVGSIGDFEVAKLKARNPISLETKILGNLKEKKASLTQLLPNRPVGCCPVGSDNGVVYRTGSACCNRTIYNASTHFCCVSDIHNYRVFQLNSNELDYCYPIDGILHCREVDLGMELAYPMKHECEYDVNDYPVSCQFHCPDGSRPKFEIEKAECRGNGVWDRKPYCCQGCEKSHQLDLWFLIQAETNNELEKITKFLNDFLSYLPISQETIQVGFYLFSDKTEDAVWDFFSHENQDSLYHTIDNLHVGYVTESDVSKTSALTRLSTNGFTEKVGDRDDVDNFVIAIIKKPLGDFMFEGAIDLKQKASVMSIAIGTGISDEDLLAIVTKPNHSYRVQHSENLSTLTLTLHNSICGEKCIMGVP